jgi:error-prone DNA polymerase
MDYTELQVTSNFSFLRGASHPGELVSQAASHGYHAIAMTDRNTMAGLVRGHAAAKDRDIKFIPGVRLDLLNGPSLLAYPTDYAAYGRLSSLLTTGNLRTEKGKCDLYRKDVYEYAKGSKFIMVPPDELTTTMEIDSNFQKSLGEYREALGKDLYLGASRSYNGFDTERLYSLDQLGRQLDTPMVATNDVHYHDANRRQLQDIVTCIREKCTIHTAGFRLHSNAERHLKRKEEMHRLFRPYPGALWRSREIADSCQFSLDSIKYTYPKEIVPEGRLPMEELTRLAWQGAHHYWGEHISEKVDRSIRHELTLIEQLGYAEYFLTVYDICRYARENNILYQGRGSAANSAVCYCLFITFVDPTKFDLLFERFLSPERHEPPDIDVDFEHERREEVIQYIYEKYGRDRAAIVATVTMQRQKGALQDVGKAMGLSPDALTRLSKTVWQSSSEWFEEDRVLEAGFDFQDQHLRKVLELTTQYMGFPRQLGQHSGGFVLTNGKLTDICPILNARMANRTNIEWDKNDIDLLGCVKIDVLSLGMLTCLHKAFDLLRKHYGIDLNLGNIPWDDPEVYKMISMADTIGLFQIESRAQQSMLPRLRPKTFRELVIQVAIVRPGPIVGGMVHPYIRRVNGEEQIEYPSEELRSILEYTKGVPLFQEQVMKIAMVAAGFTASEADQLRRSMATFKQQGLVSRFAGRLIGGMMGKGYPREYAERIFKQIEGFGSYGFPESHAAAFAHLVYISAWIKCHYPAVYAAAILNSLPMGFYQPAQLIADARRHGVRFLPVDVNYSQWDYTLEIQEGQICVCMGFRAIKGIREQDMLDLIAGRVIPYKTVESLRDMNLSKATLMRLANADAFGSLGLNRREALWQVAALDDRPIGLFTGQPSDSTFEEPANLPPMSESENVVHDYAATTLSLRGHHVQYIRSNLIALGCLSSKEVKVQKNGSFIRMAGVPFVRQRPATAKGVCFISIEDEIGNTNLIVWKDTYQKFRKPINGSKLLYIEGQLQIQQGVTHIIVTKCVNMSQLFARLTAAQNPDIPVSNPSRADGKTDPVPHKIKNPASVHQLAQGDLFATARNYK